MITKNKSKGMVSVNLTNRTDYIPEMVIGRKADTMGAENERGQALCCSAAGRL